MKTRITLFLATALFLVSCQPSTTATDITYRLEIKESGKSHTEELIEAAKRSIERRLDAMGESAESINDREEAGVHYIDIDLTNDNGSGSLTAQLREPFSFEIMKSVPLEDADIVVAETEGYGRTDISTADFAWLTAKGDASVPTEKGTVEVEFTSEGLADKKALFAAELGKNVGIFVRQRPVYKLLVERADVDSDTLVMNIPQAELGYVFADDMNTSLYITYILEE